MKVQETRGASQPREVKAPEDAKKKGTFAKVLEQKTGEEKKPEAPVDAAPRLLPRNDVTESAAPVKAAATVRDLDGLAHEISIAVRRSDVTEVEIRMDSKTLAGLQIRIAKENGKLNVRLQSNSAEISHMLAQQTDALVQRLESRGYSGAVVQVQSPPPAAFRERPARDGRQQGSRDQGNPDQRRDRQR